jgi:L-aminopeptidase/D-esterase-like protein
MNETLTAIRGLKVGHYTDNAAKTGCTVILCEEGAVCGVDVRGAAPGTRETDLLTGYHLVDRVHAVMLCGGSAFGLAAADGAMRYLSEKGIGFDSGVCPVPIVPAAVIFDLAVGNSAVRPDAKAGYAACENASDGEVPCGAVGAGTGATVGKLLGMEHCEQGGVGSFALTLPNGVVVAALVVVNAMGDVYDHHTGEILAGVNQDGAHLNAMNMLTSPFEPPKAGANTTIGVVATNARLTREETNRLATVGHDGLALAIRPVHTPFDGDTLFALSTGEVPMEDTAALFRVFAAAAEVTAQAVQRAVRR